MPLGGKGDCRLDYRRFTGASNLWGLFFTQGRKIRDFSITKDCHTLAFGAGGDNSGIRPKGFAERLFTQPLLVFVFPGAAFFTYF